MHADARPCPRPALRRGGGAGRHAARAGDCRLGPRAGLEHLHGGGGRFHAGHWQAEPGRIAVYYSETELCVILVGRVTKIYAIPEPVTGQETHL